MINSIDSRPLRIGIVAGEMSGDILGAGLIEELKKHYPNAKFEGMGGEHMLALGFHSFFPMDRLSVMGLIEPLKRLPELLGIRRFFKKHFIQNPPDVFIGIDSPDFNLSLELSLKNEGIKTVHYVSPSVWAWRQGRVKKIRKAVDHVLALLPFETRFYDTHNVPATFVGHPLADKFQLKPKVDEARAKLGLEEKGLIITVMPGSRGGEVKLLAPLFLQAIEELSHQYPNAYFVIPAANAQRKQQIEAVLEEMPKLPIEVLDGQSHVAMEAADLVLLASGTTALEAMFLKKPMVVAYKMAPLSYKIVSSLLKTPYVSLPNLLADKLLVPELLQEQATVESVVREVRHWLDNPTQVEELERQFLNLHKCLQKDASATAAQVVADLIEIKSE